jgi:hypothetical protein
MGMTKRPGILAVTSKHPIQSDTIDVWNPLPELVDGVRQFEVSMRIGQGGRPHYCDCGACTWQDDCPERCFKCGGPMCGAPGACTSCEKCAANGV